jgi:hypothetical protein
MGWAWDGLGNKAFWLGLGWDWDCIAFSMIPLSHLLVIELAYLGNKMGLSWIGLDITTSTTTAAANDNIGLLLFTVGGCLRAFPLGDGLQSY